MSTMKKKELNWNNLDNKEEWTETKIKEKVKVLKDNEIYRVADVKKFKKEHPVVKEILKKKKYKKTLLRQYFTKKHEDLYDTIVLNRDKMNLDYYGDDHVLIHLRTGDDLNDRGLTIPNIVKILQQLRNYDISKKVIIVTAMHYGHHRFSNRFYPGKVWCYDDENYKKNIELIQYFISKLNHRLVDILSNEKVDMDIMHLVFCKNLIYCDTCGNFAKCVGEWHNRYYNLGGGSVVVEKEKREDSDDIVDMNEIDSN